MPDRILRAAILTSDPVNNVSWPAEVFYRRLMSVVDDYGRYDGRVSILRSALYPLKLNQVSEADIVKWSDECSEAGLVSFYEVGDKRFLELLKFNQRKRAESKWPSPADIGGQLTANAPYSYSEADIVFVGGGKPPPKKPKEEPPNKVLELKQKSIENEIWVEQTCMQCHTQKTILLKFCEKWVADSVIKKKFETWPVNTLIGFMVTDFQKKHQDSDNTGVHRSLKKL
jgi:hypothetical protein